MMIEDGDEDLLHDVASNRGQMLDNVKHMSWFVEAVAEEIKNSHEGGFYGGSYGLE